jgi:NAD dependent epimerase/dehydratase family enzyme
VKLLFGEMGVELLLQGQRVLPTKVINQGFEFRFPQLKSALLDLSDKSSSRTKKS